MAIDSSPAPPSTDLKTELVTESNFDDFLNVNLEGWDLGRIREQAEESLKRGISHPRCRYFIVSKGGEAIGSAGTILKDGYGYLVVAVVLAKHRGHGAYRALIQRRLDDLCEMKIPFAVTQARDATSAPILEKLGFRTVFRAKIYQFKGQD